MTRDELQGNYEDYEYNEEEEYESHEEYGNNEVSIKSSLIIFGVVAVLMIAIFVLNSVGVLPWWGTLISSFAVLLAIFIAYVRIKSK